MAKMISWQGICVFSLVLVTCLPRAGAVVKVSGSLKEDTIWTKEAGPYLVQADLVVEKGVTLTLEPGTVVYVLPSSGGKKSTHSTANTDIIIKGGLEARGTSSKPIYFTPAKKGKNWGAICFQGGAKEQSSLEFCWVAYGGIYLENASPYLLSCGLTKCQFALMLYGSSHPRITKSRFIGNRSGIYVNHRKASLAMSNSEIRGNGYGLVLRDFDDLEVTSNRIHKNQVSVVNMTQRDADLSGNWWGSKDEYIIAKAIHDADDDSKLGRVKYLPLFGQSEVEAAALAALREDEAGKKMDVEISDWDYAVPTAGKDFFAEGVAGGGVGRVVWKMGVVIFSAGGAAALLLLL